MKKKARLQAGLFDLLIVEDIYPSSNSTVSFHISFRKSVNKIKRKPKMKIYIDINEIKDYRDRIIDVSPKVYAEVEIDENYDMERVRKLKQEM